MQIQEVKTFIVEAGRQNWVFVKVTTDTGLTGWGEASVEGQEKSVEACIHLLASRSVIGEDPMNIEKIWRQMYHHGFWKGGFIHMSAISGIDQALWDILGKHFNVPTYMLLGGKVRNKIRTYTHAGGDSPAAHAKQMCIDEYEFSGVKTGTGCDDPQAFEDLLRSVRAAIGNDKLLMVDNHGQLPPVLAIERLKIAAKYDLFFFEEPIPPENSEEYKLLRANSYGNRLAAGERLFNRFDARPWIENQLIDYFQPDICHCGGITEIRRMAACAEVYHIQFAPHNPNGPISTAASIQVAASTQNFAILEFCGQPVYARQDVFNMNLIPKNGYFDIPTAPGLGIEIDESKLSKYPYKDTQYEPRYSSDGTVAEI